MALLAGELRQAGLVVDPASLVACVEAWAALEPHRAAPLYWGARQTLMKSVSQLPAFDEGFARFVGMATSALEPADQLISGRPIDTADGGVVASRAETLARRDVATCDDDELREVRRAIAVLRFRAPQRPRGAWRPAGGEQIDLRATVRAAARTGGELVALPRRHRAPRPRRVVFLIDVSASMRPYSDLLIRLGHVAARALAAEVFTMGTRLTRVTAALDVPRLDVALARVERAVGDRDGGTLLAASVARLVDRWGPRGLLRGAVVVVGSDGWERDDPTDLGAQMARVAHQAKRVVWVNPHVARAGFEPIAAGMAAALPHCDELVDGASLRSVEQLVAAVAAAL